MTVEDEGVIIIPSIVQQKHAIKNESRRGFFGWTIYSFWNSCQSRILYSVDRNPILRHCVINFWGIRWLFVDQAFHPTKNRVHVRSAWHNWFRLRCSGSFQTLNWFLSHGSKKASPNGSIWVRGGNTTHAIIVNWHDDNLPWENLM